MPHKKTFNSTTFWNCLNKTFEDLLFSRQAANLGVVTRHGGLLATYISVWGGEAAKRCVLTVTTKVAVVTRPLISMQAWVVAAEVASHVSVLLQLLVGEITWLRAKSVHGRHVFTIMIAKYSFHH